MLQIAVCDDVQLYTNEISRQLRELAEEIGIEISIDVFKSFSYFQQEMKEKKYGLLIFETLLRGVNGIDFARNLRLAKCDADIIFITSTPEYALAAYSVFPTGYIVKPLLKRRLRPAFRKVAEHYMQKKSIVFKDSDGGKMAVAVEDLLYIEVIGNELYVHCRTETVNCTGSLSESYVNLPQKQFYRSHRSFIVNMNYVVRAAKYYFVMDNGDKVTIAKNRYAEAKNALADYIGD